jgi:hypothetical protein
LRTLCRLTQGALVFDDVKDYLAIDDGIAWIELTSNGKTDHLDLKVDERFAEAGLGQDSLFVCLTAEQVIALNRETGLAFREIKILR